MNKLRKSLSLALVITLVLCLLAPVTAFAAEKKVDITIMATSDLHGHLAPWDYALDLADNASGLVKAATLIKEARNANPNTIVVDNGDTIQDNMAVIFNDDPVHPMVLGLNYTDYDTWTLGNHEFNFGLDVLSRAINGFDGSVLAANIYKADGTRFVNPYIIKEVENVRVAIIGMISPNVPRWEASNPDNFKGLTFTDPVEESKKVIAELKGKADVIIGVYHLGKDSEYETPGVADVAEACPEFTAIVAGHAHADIPGAEVNGVLIVEPRSLGSRVSKIDLAVEKQNGGSWKVVDRKSENINTENVTADPEMEAAFAEYHERAREEANVIIGKITENMPAVRDLLPGIPNAQLQDTALVSFINEVQLYYTGAQISTTPLFDIKPQVMAGDFRKKDVVNIYKHDNTLTAVKITGENLKAYMEAYCGRYFNMYTPGDVTISFNPDMRSYIFDMLAGVNYEIDISKPVGERIVNLTYKGNPVTDDQVFTMAINNYRLSLLNADGLVNAEDKVYDSYELFGDGGRLRDLIIDYVGERGTVTPTCFNSWKIVGANLNNPLAETVYEMVRSGKLSIPASEDGRTLNVKSLNVPELIAQGILEEPKTETPVEVPPVTTEQPSKIIYVVVKGDCLWNLGKKYSIDYMEIVRLNKIKNPDLIYVGQKLRIPLN